MQPVEQQVNHGRRVERQDLRHDQAADDRDAERAAELRPGSRAERERQATEQRADTGGGERRQDRDRVDVTFVEDSQHDVDRDQRGEDLSVVAIIGIVLLIGIVKKNAIMMIDFALDAERHHGKSPEEAIFSACILRFRPITMTTLAALLGGLPLALGTGAGSELRRPLGIAIVGGLIFSQMLTLYTTPVVYLYLDRLSLWFARRTNPPLTSRTELP